MNLQRSDASVVFPYRSSLIIMEPLESRSVAESALEHIELSLRTLQGATTKSRDLSRDTSTRLAQQWGEPSLALSSSCFSRTLAMAMMRRVLTSLSCDRVSNICDTISSVVGKTRQFCEPVRHKPRDGVISPLSTRKNSCKPSTLSSSSLGWASVIAMVRRVLTSLSYRFR